MAPEDIDDLVKYLRSTPIKSRKCKAEKSPKEKHSLALSTLVSNPSIIGINERVISERERDFFDYSGRQVMSPDLIFSGKDICYLVEYKCLDSEAFRGKAKRQLESGKLYLPSRFRRSLTRQLYVYEDFRVLELFEGNWRYPDGFFGRIK
jgi:hypothetical protein